MERVVDIECATLNEKYLLALQNVENEFFVVVYLKYRRIECGKHIECPTRFYAAHPFDLCKELPRRVPLSSQSPLWQYEIVDALIASQCCLHSQLRWHIGAEPHIAEYLNSFDVALG